MKRTYLFYLVLGALLFCIPSYAAIQFKEYIWQTPEQEHLFSEIVQDLRCVVCQNQSLADSRAPLAQDLKQVIQQKILEQHSKEEIMNFFITRYGEFVVYDPPFSWRTCLLWGIPLFFLCFGLLFIKRKFQWEL